MSLSFFEFIRSQWAKIPVPAVPLDGKTIIVTGSNTGLGKEAARHIARLNAQTLILAVRTVEKGEAARKDILASLPESKTNILVWKLDMSTFAGVREFAEKAKKELPRLDVAILNAGIATPNWNMSPDGWEETIQTNDLSTCYLAMLLYPKLLEAANESGALKPHLTIVSSEVHFYTPFKERKADNILQTLNDKSKWIPMDRYQLSKLLEVYFAREIADWTTKHDGNQVVVNYMNPGFCKSELGRDIGGLLGFMFRMYRNAIGRTTECGSRTLVHAGCESGEETHGQYLSACKIHRIAHAVSGPEGPELQKRVWKEFGDVLTKVDPELKKWWE